jgi:hypothetical protein
MGAVGYHVAFGALIAVHLRRLIDGFDLVAQVNVWAIKAMMNAWLVALWGLDRGSPHARHLDGSFALKGGNVV